MDLECQVVENGNSAFVSCSLDSLTFGFSLYLHMMFCFHEIMFVFRAFCVDVARIVLVDIFCLVRVCVVFYLLLALTSVGFDGQSHKEHIFFSAVLCVTQ